MKVEHRFFLKVFTASMYLVSYVTSIRTLYQASEYVAALQLMVVGGGLLLLIAQGIRVPAWLPNRTRRIIFLVNAALVIGLLFVVRFALRTLGDTYPMMWV